MEEKMLILKMLQEGKITAEEAVKLLDALEKSGTSAGASAGSTSSGSRMNEIKDEFTTKLNEMKIDEKLNKLGEKATKMAEALGEKAGKLAGQLGENINAEKLGSNTEKFTGEFTKRMESLGQEIAESATKFADTFASQLDGLFEGSFEKYRYNSSYTYPMLEGASLQLRMSNFAVKAYPGDSNELKVNLTCSSNVQQLALDEFFKVITEDGNFKLTSDFPGRTRGRIDLQLPKNMEKLTIVTDNARCEISDINVKQLNCSTSNGKIQLTSCSIEETELLTDNEKVLLENVSVKTANIRTSNAKIAMNGCRLDNIDARTSNGPIMVEASRKGDYLNSSYVFNTTNGKVDIGIAKEEGLEYSVNAHTTMGSIDIKLPGLNYEFDKKNFDMQGSAELKSDNFDTASGKLSLRAVTSNGPINILQV
jgi:DUF4097 and DUF4098 domain-containing protein YvlB